MRFKPACILFITVILSGNVLAQNKVRWRFYAIRIYEKQSGCSVDLAKTYSVVWINMSKDHKKVQARLNEAAQAKHPNRWYEFSAVEGFVAIVRRTMKCNKGTTGITYSFYEAGTEKRLKEKIEDGNKQYLNSTIVQIIDISKATKDFDPTLPYIVGDY